MPSFHAQLKAACEADLGLQTPVSFPSFNDETFPAEYLLYNLLRKEEPFAHKSEVPISVLRDSLQKFADSEWRCRVINDHGKFYSPIESSDHAFFSEAIRLAKAWISNTMMDKWPQWSDASYTSGASRNSSRSQSMAFLKRVGYSQTGRMSATRSALGLITEVIIPEYGPNWFDAEVEIVNDCRFDFVHKTSSSVRFMALQPEYNLLAQQCVGNCIRDALLEATIDLNDQGWNQELAYVGSVTRQQATIDLSNSSDNIAMRHGKMFFPERLNAMLRATRVPYASVRDRMGNLKQHRLEKIAPMGNGFIFELQSLLYAGLAYAVTSLKQGREHDIAVYGDDIVISTQCAKPLMDLLVYLGMEPNLTKSYWEEETPFRESCGKHYYAGRDVTPFYVKAPLVTNRALFRAVNGLMYWQLRTGLRLPSAIKLLVGAIRKKDRLVVPQTYSIDSGLHFPVSGCTFPKPFTSYGEVHLGFQALVPTPKDVRDKLEDFVCYVDWLYNPPASIIDEALWSNIQHTVYFRNASIQIPRTREQYGMPMDPCVKSYSSGGDSESCPWNWVDRKVTHRELLSE